jgi:hypothetical protein
MAPELGFLRPQERRTVGLALAAITCVSAGFLLRGFVAPAEAAQLKDRMAALEKKATADAEILTRLDKNMARVMDRLNIPREPELPPIRTSGPSR